MKLSFWIQLLAVKRVFSEKPLPQLLYQQWQDRVASLFAVKQNIALTQAHVVKQQGLLLQFKRAHNGVAFENPNQPIEGLKLNHLR